MNTRILFAALLIGFSSAANAQGLDLNVFGAIHETSCEGGCDRFTIDEADAGVTVRLGLGERFRAELGVIDHELTAGLFFVQPVADVELEIGGGFVAHEATRNAFGAFPADRDKESYMPYAALGASMPVSGNIAAFARWMRVMGDHSFSSSDGVTVDAETVDFDDDIYLVGARFSF